MPPLIRKHDTFTVYPFKVAFATTRHTVGILLYGPWSKMAYIKPSLEHTNILAAFAKWQKMLPNFFLAARDMRNHSAVSVDFACTEVRYSVPADKFFANITTETYPELLV